MRGGPQGRPDIRSLVNALSNPACMSASTQRHHSEVGARRLSEATGSVDCSGTHFMSQPCRKELPGMFGNPQKS